MLSFLVGQGVQYEGAEQLAFVPRGIFTPHDGAFAPVHAGQLRPAYLTDAERDLVGKASRFLAEDSAAVSVDCFIVEGGDMYRVHKLAPRN